MPNWIIAVQWVSRSVLFLLLFLSTWSVATIIRCTKAMKAAEGLEKESEIGKLTLLIQNSQWEQLQTYTNQGTSLYNGALNIILKNSQSSPIQIDRAVRSYLSNERTRLEDGLTILATLGSNAPFIGLFGTVLGIIQAFGALGAHQNNTSDIMVGISESLIATAIGLFVAIPAVISYNFLSRTLRVLLVNAESLKDFYLSRSGGE